MNYISDKFCSPQYQQTMAGETCMPTVSDVSDYFANPNDNLTLLSMLPNCSGGYNSERRMMKQQVVVPVATNGAMFAGDVDGDVGGARWPRQETLTLLEVRTRLNTRFKQSTQKTPLWDEVSRIMAEEYGYNRSGKKCKEKLENLYKYYKKTKQGKVGKHDGRHYRFFKQLEALYGDQSNNDLTSVATQTKGTSKILISGQNHSMHKVRTSAFNALQSSLMRDGLEFSLSISTDLDDSSTEEEFEDDQDQCIKESSFRELIELQIRRLVEMQETWLDKILKRIEQLEQERISREEEWQRQEASRFEIDQQMWNTEQARIKARDDIIKQALERISKDREGMELFRD